MLVESMSLRQRLFQLDETYRNNVSKCCNDSRIEIGVEFGSGGVGSIGKF